MEIPSEVRDRLFVGWIAADAYVLRRFADKLRAESLDHWAVEADAIADVCAAWQLMPAELIPGESNTATADELCRRLEAFWQAVP